MATSLDPDKAPQFFDAMCKNNKIVIISATYCTFCVKLKMLFIEMKERFVTLEIDIIPNGRALFADVALRTQVNTVPQVFVKGKFIGGYDDIMDKFQSGELKKLLDAAAK
jgi:glutaredoxin 3